MDSSFSVLKPSLICFQLTKQIIMNEHIRLTKISTETKLELFVLREYLKKNGFQIKAETSNSSILVPIELYSKIRKKQ